MLREFGEFLLPSIFCIIYMLTEKHYPGETVTTHIKSLIDIIQD